MQKNWIYLRICLVIVDMVYDFILNGSIRNACCGVGQKKKKKECLLPGSKLFGQV